MQGGGQELVAQGERRSLEQTNGVRRHSSRMTLLFTEPMGSGARTTQNAANSLSLRRIAGASAVPVRLQRTPGRLVKAHECDKVRRSNSGCVARRQHMAVGAPTSPFMPQPTISPNETRR